MEHMYNYILGYFDLHKN